MRKSKNIIISIICVLIIVLLCCCLKSRNNDPKTNDNVTKFETTDQIENNEKEKYDSVNNQEKTQTSDEKDAEKKDSPTLKNDKAESSEKIEEPKKIPVDSSKEEKLSHVHNWNAIYKIIHHDEVGHKEKVLVSEAWDEEVPVYEKVFVMICNECDHVMRNAEELDAHFRENYECGSWRDANITEQVGTEIIHHEAVYEERYIVDKEAWDEQVTEYYRCNCGDTKY